MRVDDDACVRFTLFSAVTYASSSNSRRCGQNAHPNPPAPGRRSRVREADFDSATCDGAAIDGSLNISVREIERRCAADLQCAGYSYRLDKQQNFDLLPEYADAWRHGRERTLHQAVPLVGFWNWAPVTPQYATFIKEDLCAIDREPSLVAAHMASWAEHAWLQLSEWERNAERNRVRANRSALLSNGTQSRYGTAAATEPASLASVLSGFRAFAEERLPPRARRLPVFYPFSGFDLLTARSFFAHSPRGAPTRIESALTTSDQPE